MASSNKQPGRGEAEQQGYGNRLGDGQHPRVAPVGTDTVTEEDRAVRRYPFRRRQRPAGQVNAVFTGEQLIEVIEGVVVP